ncbi:MAG: lipid II:glycine glycyltransferase FemX [Anaerorhabdus sp.]
MYKLEELKEKDFDDFAQNHQLNSIFQTSSWAAVKSNWTPFYIGVFEQKQIIGACMFICRKLPFGFSFAYAPRGPLLDFNNQALVHFFLKNITHLLRKKKVILAKIDPNLSLGYLNLDEKNSLASLQHNKNKYYLSTQYTRYCTQQMALKDSIQPRVQLPFPLHEDIDSRIPSKTKKKIKSCLKKDVIVVEEHTSSSLVSMVQFTEKRHHINLRNTAYFDALLHHFKDNSCVLSAYQNGTLISSCLLVRSKNCVEILYSGYHDDYRKTDSTYLLREQSIQWAKKQGCLYFNFGGVEGNLEDGLFMFKSSFNPQLCLYIGEFDLLTIPICSRIISLLFPIIKNKISF